jgi:RsiW-degrading membrane proteinase PrsW (M82 family)
MKYYYRDQNQHLAGPYSAAELRQLHLAGVVKPDMLAGREGSEINTKFVELWPAIRAEAEASADPPPPLAPSFTALAGEDLRALVPHLLVPLRELRDFNWLDNRKLLSIAGVGLLPLVIYAAFAEQGDIRNAYWAIAFYFSALWAMFFYYLFPAPQVRVSDCAVSFFGTGLISISILLLAYRVPPLTQLFGLTRSDALLARLPGYILGVGLPEEACKALVLYYFWRRMPVLPPQAMLFYGLMSGLGFGIYEGVDYQTGRNLRYAAGIGDYYLLNVLRLTTLPFLHAIWTGMAGYFIGFARQYPQRRRGLLIVAIGAPALLHGVYDTFGTNLLGLAVVLLSVMALILYLAKSVDFEKALNAQKTP